MPLEVPLVVAPLAVVSPFAAGIVPAALPPAVVRPRVAAPLDAEVVPAAVTGDGVWPTTGFGVTVVVLAVVVVAVVVAVVPTVGALMPRLSAPKRRGRSPRCDRIDSGHAFV